jgi:hypothetical protein
MKDDALKGVKHKKEEVLVHEKTLNFFEHYCPPYVPNDLAIRIYNMSSRKTYVVRIFEVVEFTTLPKRKK